MTTSPQVANSALLKHDQRAMQRDAWVEIDLNCLEANVQTIKGWLYQQATKAGIRPPQVMVALKADAYGHGAVATGQALSACGINWLGVASVDEGSQLRQAGNKSSILVLGTNSIMGNY